MANVKKLLLVVLAAMALSGCIQTLKQTPVDDRSDVRLVEWITSDGTVDRSYYQVRERDGNWYEGERKNGIWGLSEMGRIEYKRSQGRSSAGGGAC